MSLLRGKFYFSRWAKGAIDFKKGLSGVFSFQKGLSGVFSFQKGLSGVFSFQKGLSGTLYFCGAKLSSLLTYYANSQGLIYGTSSYLYVKKVDNE